MARMKFAASLPNDDIPSPNRFPGVTLDTQSFGF